MKAKLEEVVDDLGPTQLQAITDDQSRLRICCSDQGRAYADNEGNYLYFWRRVEIDFALQGECPPNTEPVELIDEITSRLSDEVDELLLKRRLQIETRVPILEGEYTSDNGNMADQLIE